MPKYKRVLISRYNVSFTVNFSHLIVLYLRKFTYKIFFLDLEKASRLKNNQEKMARKIAKEKKLLVRLRNSTAESWQGKEDVKQV